MQGYKWLTLTVLLCLMWGTPWNWHADTTVIVRQLSDHAAAQATLQAVAAQLGTQQAASEAALQAVRAQLGIQHEATLQALQEQARLLAAHVGGPVPAEQLMGGHSITGDPPHSEGPAVSIKC